MKKIANRLFHITKILIIFILSSAIIALVGFRLIFVGAGQLDQIPLTESSAEKVLGYELDQEHHQLIYLANIQGKLRLKNLDVSTKEKGVLVELDEYASLSPIDMSIENDVSLSERRIGNAGFPANSALTMTPDDVVYVFLRDKVLKIIESNIVEQIPMVTTDVLLTSKRDPVHGLTYEQAVELKKNCEQLFGETKEIVSFRRRFYFLKFSDRPPLGYTSGCFDKTDEFNIPMGQLIKLQMRKTPMIEQYQEKIREVLPISRLYQEFSLDVPLLPGYVLIDLKRKLLITQSFHDSWFGGTGTDMTIYSKRKQISLQDLNLIEYPSSAHFLTKDGHPILLIDGVLYLFE